MVFNKVQTFVTRIIKNTVSQQVGPSPVVVHFFHAVICKRVKVTVKFIGKHLWSLGQQRKITYTKDTNLTNPLSLAFKMIRSCLPVLESCYEEICVCVCFWITCNSYLCLVLLFHEYN